MVAGVVGGFIAGLLGVGGGVVYILVLPMFLISSGVCDENMVAYIIANSVFTILAVSLSANFRQVIKGNFPFKETFTIGLFGAFSSVLCMQFVVQSDWYSKTFFNVVVLGLLLFMLVRLFQKIKPLGEGSGTWKYIIIGVLAGAASALSGLGGGVVIVPMLLYFFGLEVRQAKTISLGVIGVMAAVLSIKNLMTDELCLNVEGDIGLVVFPVSLLLSLGVVFGAPLGVKISKYVSERWLKILFGLMLLVVIVKKIYEIAKTIGWL